MTTYFNKNELRLTYFLLVLIIGSSGTLCFSLSSYLTIALIPILVLILVRKKIHIEIRSYFFLLIISLLLLFRTLYGEKEWDYFITRVPLYTFIMLSAYLVRRRFVDCYINMMVCIAVLSLIFWSLIQISPTAYNLILSVAHSLPQFSHDPQAYSSNPAYSLYIFTVPINSLLAFRNSGPFYEPGLYVVYLMSAFSIGIVTKSFSLFSKKSIIILLALVTTFSTTGYCALIFLLAVYIPFAHNVHWIIKVLLVCFLLYSIPVISNLDFMRDKIISTMSMTGNTQSRFYASVYHMQLVTRSLIDMMFGYLGEAREISPNGLTMVMVMWGIPFTIIYYLLLFKGVFRVIKDKLSTSIYFKFLVVITILITVFSQVATTYPLFFLILFLGTQRALIRTYK